MKGHFRVTPLHPVRLTWVCECRNGTMIYGSPFNGTLGSRHEHKCSACGREESARRVYPCVEYRESSEHFHEALTEPAREKP